MFPSGVTVSFFNEGLIVVVMKNYAFIQDEMEAGERKIKWWDLGGFGKNVIYHQLGAYCQTTI